MSLMGMLRTTGTLKRKVATKDTSGGHSSAFEPVSGAVNLRCDIQPATGNIQQRFMQYEQIVTHSVYLAQSISPKAGDVWVSNNRTFLFQGMDPTPPGYTNWPAVMHVEEINP